MFLGTLQGRRGFAPLPQLTTEEQWYVHTSPCTSPLWVYLTYQIIRIIEDYFSSQGIMLVYDISNEKSFENIKNWIRNIEEVSNSWTSHKMSLYVV